MRIVLINAPLHSVVSDRGVGHHIPLELLMLGGPLLDAGHAVTLIDAARFHLTDTQIVRSVADYSADLVLIAHVGSTPVHPTCLRVVRAVKAALPHVITIYGGVHPTYHYRTILTEEAAVDIIVRGEGEATIVELVACLASSSPLAGQLPDLSHIFGIAWRPTPDTVVHTPTRAPIEDLDANRIGWELVRDWNAYQAFGLGRAAVVQFSRGCPHTCTYCGQWMFWKQWRHRDIMRFVDELMWLHTEHGVQFFWLADENPTTIQSLWRELLEEISRRSLNIHLCASIRAQDIVRDAEFLPLYRQAGMLYVLMGVETVNDATLHRIHKGSNVDDAYQAVRLLRRHHIMSIIDYIFGLEEESWASIWRGLRGLLSYDSDFVNALYLTPHAWTPLGHQQLQSTAVVEPDMGRWDYRHQVLAVPHLTPAQLFTGVKLVEVFYHLHPKRLRRILSTPDAHLQRQLRFSLWQTALVFFAEIHEHLLERMRVAFHSRRSVNSTVRTSEKALTT